MSNNVNIFNVPYEELTLRIDKQTFDYLRDEAKRSHLRVDMVAAAFLANAVFENKHIEESEDENNGLCEN